MREANHCSQHLDPLLLGKVCLEPSRPATQALVNTFYSSCRRSDSIPSPPSVNSYLDSAFKKTNQAYPTMHNHLSASLPDLLPRLQPTPITGVKVARIPPDFHEGALDLDPTEWKPAERVAGGAISPRKHGSFTPGLNSGRSSPFGGSSTSLSNSWKPKLQHRPNSAASLYLGQFHTSSDSLKSTKHRSARATSSLNTQPTPGLSDSPTVSSTGSVESLGGTPYELVTRPRSASRPTTAVTTSPSEECGVEVSYEKQILPSVIDQNLRSASGSLKELLTGAQKTKAAM